MRIFKRIKICKKFAKLNYVKTMIPRVKIMVAIDSACPKLVITSLKLIAKMSFSGRKFGAKLKNPKNRVLFLLLIYL